MSCFSPLQVQTDPCMSTESLQVEMRDLNQRLEELERRGVELERSLRDCEDGGGLLGGGGRHCCWSYSVVSHSREGGGADAAGVVRPAPRQAPAGAQRRRALSPVSGTDETNDHEDQTKVDSHPLHAFSPPGPCSTGWRRSRRTWSTSCGASSTSRVSVCTVATFFITSLVLEFSVGTFIQIQAVPHKKSSLRTSLSKCLLLSQSKRNFYPELDVFLCTP